ncbi:MAG: glycosyltransferase family 2 protein [Nitrospira sp.]|nr:MAG: glycosyltransferase family 2 protein [Nitrospira sp.]
MLTVLIATRNGSRTLPGVLDAFTLIQAPSSGWKLVVVDNGSTDRTREIIESFQPVLPVTYVFEGSLGKNAALNTGLAHVDGDLIVFTDDDVFPRPGWLIQLRAAADDHPLYTMFGGVILPRWEVEPPPWLEWVPPAPVFAFTDPRLREGSTDSDSLFGGNMAIRAEVFNGGTRFDVSIGPRGANYPMGSETELLRRLKRQGHKAWHVQEAVVEHFIRAYQMDKSWVLRRAIRFGRGGVRLSKSAEPATAPSWLGVPPCYFLWILKRLIKIAVAWLKSNEQELFVSRWHLNCIWGHVVEARLSRRRRYFQGDKEA